MIEIPSFSGEESATADSIQNWLDNKGVDTKRIQTMCMRLTNTLIQRNPTCFSIHITTLCVQIKPIHVTPTKPEVINGKLFGLGSNDAGGALVSLLGLLRISTPWNHFPIT